MSCRGTRRTTLPQIIHESKTLAKYTRWRLTGKNVVLIGHQRELLTKKLTRKIFEIRGNSCQNSGMVNFRDYRAGIPGDLLASDVKYRRGMKNSRFSTKTWLYRVVETNTCSRLTQNTARLRSSGPEDRSLAMFCISLEQMFVSTTRRSDARRVDCNSYLSDCIDSWWLHVNVMPSTSVGDLRGHLHAFDAYWGDGVDHGHLDRSFYLDVHEWTHVRTSPDCIHLLSPYYIAYVCRSLKPGFHYPSWRRKLTARVDGWPVSITRQHGPCWRVM